MILLRGLIHLGITIRIAEHRHSHQIFMQTEGARQKDTNFQPDLKE